MRRTYPSGNFIVPFILVHSGIPSRFRTSHFSRLLWHTPLCLPNSLHSTITNSSSKSLSPFTSEAFSFLHCPVFTSTSIHCRSFVFPNRLELFLPSELLFLHRPIFTSTSIHCQSFLCLNRSVFKSTSTSTSIHRQSFSFRTLRCSPLHPPPFTVEAFFFHTVWYLPLPPITVGAFCFYTVQVHLYLPSELSLSAPSDVYFHNL